MTTSPSEAPYTEPWLRGAHAAVPARIPFKRPN